MTKYIALFLMVIMIISCGTNEESNNEEPTSRFVNWYRIKTQIQYSEDGTEIYRQEFSFDSEGREIGFISYHNGSLSGQNTDYKNDGMNQNYNYCSYYSNGSVETTKIKLGYLDSNYIKQKYYIQYNDNETEKYKLENVYDEEGRKIGSNSYSNGKITSREMNYKYDGLACTFDIVHYGNNGVETSSHKFKHIYLDKNYTKTKNHIQYDDNGTEKWRQEFTYDSNGREMGLTEYTEDKLTTKQNDYKYENESCTYYTTNYTNGIITNKYKIKRDYFNR